MVAEMPSVYDDAKDGGALTSLNTNILSTNILTIESRPQVKIRVCFTVKINNGMIEHSRQHLKSLLLAVILDDQGKYFKATHLLLHNR